MKTEPHPAHASATALVALAAPAPVVALPARVPLDAPSIPEAIVRPWERVVPAALMLALVVIWFVTTAPAR